MSKHLEHRERKSKGQKEIIKEGFYLDPTLGKTSLKVSIRSSIASEHSLNAQPSKQTVFSSKIYCKVTNKLIHKSDEDY